MASPPASHAVPAGTSALRAYRGIRSLIIAGRLAPGARLVEADLAAHLGVSRGAVRPALQRLWQEGFAAPLRPGMQARLIVTPLTREDAQDLYGLMAALEGLAASHAAACDREARRSLLRTLEDVQKSLRRQVRATSPDPAEVLAVDRAFHEAILDAGADGRPRLRSLHASLRPQLDRYSLLYAGPVMAHLEAVLEEHAAIISALAAGDAAAASSAVRLNWESGAARVAEAIDQWGARGDLSLVPDDTRD